VKKGTDDKLYYAYTDHLGNVVAWTNASGGMVGSSLARYEPFGTYRTKPPSSVNPDISDRGFTGHRQNNTGAYDLGLIYMNARYYLPEVGRFISPDSIVPEPGNPQSYNRYAYGFNNPVKYVDPSGHDPLDAAWEEAFFAQHGRAPEWYDRLIRLFSIAFPEEWEWSAFYDSNGYLRGYETLQNIMTTPSSSRSWANMDEALTRMSAYYNWNESEMFARDIGTLFAGLPDRFSGNMNYAVIGCTQGFRCSNRQPLPAQVWAYLQPDGMPSYLRGDDPDSNVHHWAWSVALGAYTGDLAVALNTGREVYDVKGINNLMSDSNAKADVYLGNRGAYFGSALHMFGPRTVPFLYRFYVAEW